MEQSYVFHEHPSIFIRFMPLLFLFSLSSLGISEMIGKHLQYSKFCNANPRSKFKQLSSRAGMLVSYLPAFLAGVSSFALFPAGGLRFLLLRLAITIHFLKRVLEVLFVHNYSGGITAATAALISASYFTLSASMIYVQHLTLGVLEPSVDLKHLGVPVFLVGISGNFYHHYLLSKLRENGGDKGYKLPRGGLFNLVICPHYLFEIIGFFGFFFISQTLLSLSTALGIALYLTGRSYATRKWYLSKFENFPVEVKALIPFVF